MLDLVFQLGDLLDNLLAFGLLLGVFGLQDGSVEVVDSLGLNRSCQQENRMNGTVQTNNDDRPTLAGSDPAEGTLVAS